jgi:glycosyltransferase involved in cell wall biosynthesis
MKVAVVTSSPPMTEGGHMVIARSLAAAIRGEGHEAAVVVTPQNRFGRQASAYIATWLTDIGASDGRPVDQVISLRYPSYAVRHRNHVCWLNHTMREYYDLWDRFSATLSPQGKLKETIRRRVIQATDRYLLTRNVKRLFVQSRTIQERFRMWPTLHSRVLYPPAPPRDYRCEDYGDYIFMVSRLTPLKRADLVVRALAEPAAAGIRAVIAGDGEERGPLEQLVSNLGVASRVTLTGRLTEPEVLGHLSRCRAVCFPPLLEDYGFVTVEAFASRKAVITCRDSGGPAELVRDGQQGLVCEPTPRAIAGALLRVMDDRAFAERLGGQAHARGAELTWPDTVRALIAVN